MLNVKQSTVVSNSSAYNFEFKWVQFSRLLLGETKHSRAVLPSANSIQFGELECNGQFKEIPKMFREALGDSVVLRLLS